MRNLVMVMIMMMMAMMMKQPPHPWHSPFSHYPPLKITAGYQPNMTFCARIVHYYVRRLFIFYFSSILKPPLK